MKLTDDGKVVLTDGKQDYEFPSVEVWAQATIPALIMQVGNKEFFQEFTRLILKLGQQSADKKPKILGADGKEV